MEGYFVAVDAWYRHTICGGISTLTLHPPPTVRSVKSKLKLVYRKQVFDGVYIGVSTKHHKAYNLCSSEKENHGKQIQILPEVFVCNIIFC